MPLHFKILLTLRDPLVSLSSVVNHWLQFRSGKYLFAESIYDNIKVHIDIFNYLHKFRKKVFVVQLENLHLKSNKVLKDLCKLLKIDYKKYMAKKSSVNRNKKRIALNLKFANKRRKLKEIIMNKKISLEERFKAQMKLSKLPRNSSKIRVKNRCEITGRSHGVYRKLKISRIILRKLTLAGKVPGMIKSSW